MQNNNVLLFYPLRKYKLCDVLLKHLLLVLFFRRLLKSAFFLTIVKIIIGRCFELIFNFSLFVVFIYLYIIK